MADSTSTNGGIGFVGILTLIFITLKLVGQQFPTPVATWSWWWVLSPLWISALLWIACILTAALIVATFGRSKRF